MLDTFLIDPDIHDVVDRLVIFVIVTVGAPPSFAATDQHAQPQASQTQEQQADALGETALDPIGHCHFEALEVGEADREDRERDRVVGQRGVDACAAQPRTVCQPPVEGGGSGREVLAALDLTAPDSPRGFITGDLGTPGGLDIIVHVNRIAETDEHRFVDRKLGQDADLHTGPGNGLRRRDDRDAIRLDPVGAALDPAVRAEDQHQGEAEKDYQGSEQRDAPPCLRSHPDSPVMCAATLLPEPWATASNTPQNRAVASARRVVTTRGSWTPTIRNSSTRRSRTASRSSPAVLPMRSRRRSNAS